MTDGLDLYEFPADYTGRKTYVGVQGHLKSIPKYKTYIGTDRRNHLRPEYGGTWDHLGNTSTFLLPDKLEYVSPMDGSVISSRSTHNEHMRRHDVVEAGDIKFGSIQRQHEMAPVRPDIMRSIEELRSR